MTETPKETFYKKAPLLGRGTLADAIRDHVLAPPIDEAMQKIWLHGAFADPRRGLDHEDLEAPEGPPGLSPLEVFVVLDGWRDVHVSTRYTAGYHGLLRRLAAQGCLDVYTDARLDDDRHAPVVSDDVRDAVDVPVDALETTLRRAERTTFHVRQFDVDQHQYRGLQLTLGGQAAFRRLVAMHFHHKLWPALDD